MFYKFFQTVRVRETASQTDEWTQYEGEDRQAAIDAAIEADGYLTDSERKAGNYTEVREFWLEKPYEELDEYEKCDALCSCHNLVAFTGDVQDKEVNTPTRLAEEAGVSLATVYNRARELGRLPTIEELQKRKSTGRPRKYF